MRQKKAEATMIKSKGPERHQDQTPDPSILRSLVMHQACLVSGSMTFAELAAHSIARSLLRKGRIDAAERLATAAGIYLD